jgi:hypothetical protein
MRAFGIVAILVMGAWAAHLSLTRAQSRPAAEAEGLYQERMGDPVWRLEYTGEDFAWHAAYGMSGFLEGYEATGDTVFLDWGVKYYDALIARMAEGPDGYRGWIGPFEYNDKYWCDDHVADAILFDGILDFGLAVIRDPKLQVKYGAKVRQYVELAKKDVIEKWDARGTWRDDGPFGVYVAWDKYGDPGQYKQWSVRQECAANSNLTLPFNKQIDVGVVALRIWQITGEQKYKQRAEKIFGFMKSRMQRYKDEYHWNYFEPGGQWDLAEGAEHIRHWVGVHPERNYQTGEVSNILKAYNAGIVFTQEDIQGIANTNLKMMWNQDRQRPRFANSNADLLGSVTPAAFEGEHAGELWGALAQVDAMARTLLASRAGEGIGDEYFRNVTVKSPANFVRREAPAGVRIPAVYAQFPLGNVRTVQMGAVLPSVFTSGQKTVIACKLIEPGELEVTLVSSDGKTKLATLHQGKEPGGPDGRDGIFYFSFNGTNPATRKAFPPGDYRVRWTVTGNGYREFPVTIRAPKTPGEK